MAYINPVPGGRVTSEFGYRAVFGDNHLGIDIGAPRGTNILAVGPGQVDWVQWWDWKIPFTSPNMTYGNVLRIRHENGDTSLYAHCDTILVGQGSWVRQGDVIAKVGTTGNSTGNHLHLEIQRGGVRIDPRSVIDFSISSPTTTRRKRVCLDPGHGGADPGAVNPVSGAMEKDIVLDVALEVRDFLTASGVEVKMTRERDTGLDLLERARISNAFGADAFISIHMNSFGTSGPHGLETYSWNGAWTPQLVEAVHKSILDAGLYRADRGTKRADFSVLRNTYAIACLVEMAFISNDEDLKLVTSNKTQFARAIAQGICNFLGVTMNGGPDMQKQIDALTKRVASLEAVLEQWKIQEPAEWSAKDWKRATELGIVDGDRPRAPLTRQEYAVTRLRDIDADTE